eukprot:CAMPEP_0194194158 /NCGR_PEP_ID=MMETSP0154-20130528/75429_1 /TAXON_ID=1049557 /ORGANISM="Thalassiothrix antarctica, Strain L6-D1" /LENGTH=750 /DNA_ID=CAMNT_0038918561 /DNA_START=233 /DNA_END=2482 /DNA_ORIENTATION=+
MLGALAALNTNSCLDDCTSEICETNFFIIQAHHDYCLESEIPEEVETGLHIYEDVCKECEILPKFDAALDACPAHSCTDGSGTAVFEALVRDNCEADCSGNADCGTNFQTLLAVHDLCEEDTLSLSAELGFHEMEESCAQFACNLSDGSMDSMQLVCDDHDSDDHDSHDHDSHDDGGDDHKEHLSCACAAEDHGFAIDCGNGQAMIEALAALNINDCLTDCTSEICETNFFIIQAHHDYCLESELPDDIEDGLHIFEDVCGECEILPKFDSDLEACPAHSCTDGSGTAAFEALVRDNCEADCSGNAQCGTNFQTLLAVHDLCEEDTLSLSAELGFHEMEESCAQFACNLSDGSTDSKQLVCDDHDSHDDGGDDHKEHLSCACAAEDHGFAIDCGNGQAMIEALAALNINDCLTDCTSEICETNFFIIQAHHDYCLESELPDDIEDGLHIFEDVCGECEILPKFDSDLEACPAHSCTDGSGTAAFEALVRDNCEADCSGNAQCGTNFQTLLAVHDLCEEDTLSLSAELGFHEMEESCAQFACNLSDGSTDSMQLVCDDHEEPAPEPPVYCFSGASTANLEDGTTIALKNLKIGDRVQVTKDGKFDEVYSFGHYQPDSVGGYLSIHSTASVTPILISALHMLFLDNTKAVPAAFVNVGDVLLGGYTVTKIKNVNVQGAFAPFTYSGTIVIDNVVASNYVSLTGSSTFLGLDMQLVAHNFAAARRLLCQLNLCKESYSKEGIATWIPYKTANW